MICVGIYAVLVEGISTSGDNISAAIWGCMGYTVLLCYTCLRPAALQNPCSVPTKRRQIFESRPLLMWTRTIFPNLCLMKLSSITPDAGTGGMVGPCKAI